MWKSHRPPGHRNASTIKENCAIGHFGLPAGAQYCVGAQVREPVSNGVKGSAPCILAEMAADLQVD
jgi:hypothetical protein